MQSIYIYTFTIAIRWRCRFRENRYSGFQGGLSASRNSLRWLPRAFFGHLNKSYICFKARFGHASRAARVHSEDTDITNKAVLH
jgi:hypothetical protein